MGQKLPTLEAALAERVKSAGVKRQQDRTEAHVDEHRKGQDKKSATELEIVDWINDLSSDGVSARVSTGTTRIKNKAIQLNLKFYAEHHPPSDLADNNKYRKRHIT